MDKKENKGITLEELLASFNNNPNNLGIPGNGFQYQNLGSGQDATEEFFKTQNFLRKIFLERIVEEAPEIVDPNMRLEFINYGDTQQVYVLTANGKQWSVLVTQPGTKFGTGKKEHDNLRQLATICPEVIVKPEYYFEDNGKELYIAPYIYQARCIASQDYGYGVYVPEPYYRFDTFSPRDRETVNICMIANLVRLYDEEKGQGIGACKIGGGDFILDKAWDTSDKSIDSTLGSMKLIAAREMVPMSLSDYEQQLLIEFSERTYYKRLEDRDPNVLINHKNRIPMTYGEIGNGIELGRQLRKKL